MTVQNSTKFLVAGALLVACQSSDRVDPDHPTPDEVLAPLVTGPERELGRGNAATFTVAQDGFQAGHDTHAALIRDTGIVDLTPVRPVGPGTMRGDALVLETVAISADDGLFAGPAFGTRVRPTGEVEIDRGSVLEVWRNEEDGVRQEWEFANAPPLAGDLVVEVTVRGQRFVSATDSGLHFMGADGLGFRYSHAIWIDSAGKEWPIQAAFSDDRIRMVVPGPVVELTQFPAVLDPTIGAEVAVDSPVIGGSGANVFAPQVATDGTHFLVVWSDQRNGLENDIWGVRVGSDGTLLDPAGIEIASGPGVQSNPTVVFDGTSYVVAWEDFKVAGGNEADIDVARVSTAGAVTQLAAIATTAASETNPEIASTGAGTLLTWSASNNIMGSVSLGTPFAIAASANVEKNQVVAGGGGGYLVVFTETVAAGNDDLRGQLVTGAGALSGSVFNISATTGSQDFAGAAFDGSNYVVVWSQTASGGADIYGTRVSTAGAVLDTRVVNMVAVGGVPVDQGPSNQEFPSVACVGTSCLVAWQDRRNLAATGFDVLGLVINTSTFTLGSEITISAPTQNQNIPRLTATGGGFFATWLDLRTVNQSLAVGARISSGGGVTDANGIILVTGNNQQTSPATVRAGTQLGVVWSDSRSTSGNDIAMVRFNTNGAKADAVARMVSTAANSQFSPAGAELGGNYFFVWADSRGGVNKDIYGARFNPTSGTPIDAAGLAISTAAGDQLVPAVASNGTDALVVWHDRRNGSFDIFGAIVNSSGSVSANFPISTAAFDQFRPFPVWNASTNQFVVVWQDGRTSGGNGREIYAARVTTAGSVLDANGVLVASPANGAFNPQIAISGSTMLAVWEDRRNGITNSDIFGARLTAGASLTVLDTNGIAVSTAAGSQGSPTIASVGTSFVVAWRDARAFATTSNDIYGQQVSTSGVLSGGNFVISANPEDEGSPSLSFVTTGNARVSYEKRRPDLDTIRVQSRTISVGTSTGQTCSSGANCSSGFCVDSYCCDTACGNDSRSDCQACAFSKTLQPNGTCAPIAAGTICRNFANPSNIFCDLREQCDGVNVDCPPDIGRNQGLVCNSTTMTVCPPNDASGAPHVCP